MFENYFFQDLKEEEEPIRIIRKHWAGYLGVIILTFIILIIPFFFVFFMFSSVWGIIVFFVWVSVGFAYGLHQWVSWYFDSFILTNMRIINIDQKGIFSRSVSETHYENIEEVTYEINGLLATAFNYGSVKIQTAGAESYLSIKAVPNPKSIQELILSLQKNALDEQKDISAEELVEYITSVKSKGKEQDVGNAKQAGGSKNNNDYPSF